MSLPHRCSVTEHYVPSWESVLTMIYPGATEEMIRERKSGARSFLEYPLLDHDETYKWEDKCFVVSHAYWSERSEEQLRRLMEEVGNGINPRVRVVTRDATWSNLPHLFKQVFIFGFDDEDVIQELLALPYHAFDSRCAAPRC